MAGTAVETIPRTATTAAIDVTMTFDPRSLDLDALFASPVMFDSRAAWSAAGFQIVTPAKPTECMVASHSSAPGYLFKKYATGNLSTKEQNENYATRIEGGERLAKFIAKRGLRHVVVPKKYLHALPKRFGKDARVLVVERLDILAPNDAVSRYHSIAEAVLRELMMVIAKFKGLDSNAKNIPFLRDDRIAFVDLEHWDRHKKSRLKVLGSYLSKENLALAHKLLAG